ncbi:MAG TPA: phosphatidylglycerol lysyltransferase domain-containing protein [Acidimicrobiales bacterium]|nr:phosphatidylglycerol lysyltransferase domain-containing protein [Acidimicrobiales bacterium]
MAADALTVPSGQTEVPGEVAVEVEVAVGGRVLVVADLLLERAPTPASASAVAALVKTVEAWTGPGVLVVAGNLFDLLGSTTDPAQALAAHPRLAGALRGFGAEGRRVVVVPGSRDRRLALAAGAGWAERELGATVASAVELIVHTGAGGRRVRVEAGDRFDPRWTPSDPSPLGLHVAQQVLPSFGGARATWLAGVERLANDADLPRFVASRVLYRRVARQGWWLLLPFVATALLSRRTAFVIGLSVLDVALVAGGVYWLSRRAWSGLSGVALGERGQAQNDAARDEGRRLVTAGWAGLVTGHTRRPELAHLGHGFYANCGAAAEVVDDADARLGLPPVFLPYRELSWVELEAGAELHARLLRSRMELSGGTWLERLVARRQGDDDPMPAVRATFPQGGSWPLVADPGRSLRTTRRVGAAAIALAGVLDLVSAVTPPVGARLGEVTSLVPLAVPQAATALVALAGIALLLLSRGVRKGQRNAWRISVALVAGSALLHVVKGVDVEEAVAASAVLGYLLRRRAAFQTTTDVPAARRGLAVLGLGAMLATLVGVLTIEVFGYGSRRLSLWDAVAASGERLVGITNIAVPDRVDDFITPALGAVGFGLVAFAGWLLFRPVRVRRAQASSASAASSASVLARARSVVDAYGSGTLDYFALRNDKELFFDGGSMVAYGLHNGVCLVSPDPIGPPAERDQVWAAFRRFADSHGWTLAVLGAGEEWLPIYRAAGMHDLYVGDEAVVDVRRFSLDGGRNKSLRQAVNRVANHGYTLTFHDPAGLDDGLAADLREVMVRSRRGDVERGFSMTLGRVFEPADVGLLLAVAWGPSGSPVAFCQFVPAPGIDGYSLDLMRRDQGDHPNGLIDFIVAGTIAELRARGMRGLGLNFATMRAALAGEAGDSLTQRVEAWVLRRMSDSMQIESLWKFNAKFEPDWQPRYAVYDAPEHLLPVAMAIARAESFWELPVIGRFLQPTTA